jgi:phytoene dehydrogenase-like protein
MSADVIVIGAGYGGLTVGAILAHNGIEVEVHEATGHLGGRATFDRKDGFLVDYGIHANRYAAEGAAAAALKEIGYQIDFVSMGEPQLWRKGSFIDLPTGVPEFLKAKFLSLGDKMYMIGNMLRLVLASPDKKADIPLDNSLWGTDRVEIGPLFKLLSGIGLVAPDISTTSTGEFTKFLKKALKAKETVAYPRGGTSQIIEVLSERIEKKGSIVLNSRVKALEFDAGKFTGARVKEDVLEARAVVFAVPLQKLPEIAGDGIGRPLAEKCESLMPTAGISVDLCLSSKVSDIDGLIVTPDPVTMGQFTSNVDPTTAPEGKQLATWYYPLPVEMMDDRDAVEAEEKRFLAILDEMFPGIMDRVEWERTLRLKMVDGFEPRAGQTAKDRPGVRVPGVENMFLAGDCVAAQGNGGDVAFASAVEAARAVMAYLK